MKREIAREIEVTSVEYVRHGTCPVHNRAAEVSGPAYIAWTDGRPAFAGLFFGQGLIRTVEWSENLTVPMGGPDVA